MCGEKSEFLRRLLKVYNEAKTEEKLAAELLLSVGLLNC